MTHRRRMHDRCALIVTAVLAGGLVLAGCGGSAGEPGRTTAPTARSAATKTATVEPGSSAKQGSSANGASSAKPGSGASTRTATTSAGATQTSPGGSKAPKRRTATPPVKTVPIPATRAKLGTAQTFSGDGDRTLGSVTLKRSSVVRWTVTGGAFALVDGVGKLSISGKAKSGQTFVAAGSYHDVKVTANGNWTLSLTPLGD